MKEINFINDRSYKNKYLIILCMVVILIFSIFFCYVNHKHPPVSSSLFPEQSIKEVHGVAIFSAPQKTWVFLENSEKKIFKIISGQLFFKEQCVLQSAAHQQIQFLCQDARQHYLFIV